MQPRKCLEGCIGATLFLAGAILVYGLADLIEVNGMKEYRAMASISGGPYEPVGDWTDDKELAALQGAQEVIQWGSVRTDYYLEEREIEEEGIYDEQ